MREQDIEEMLRLKGFCEEKRDSGYHLAMEKGPIKLICYIEPGIEVEFVSIYSWSNNDVKGTYTIPVRQLAGFTEPIASLFRRTKNNLPQWIGLTTDTHEELKKVIKEVFFTI